MFLSIMILKKFKLVIDLKKTLKMDYLFNKSDQKLALFYIEYFVSSDNPSIFFLRCTLVSSILTSVDFDFDFASFRPHLT